MTDLVDRILTVLFSDEPHAPAMIEDLPGPTERVQLAALKLSGGELERLERAARIAWTDWRDLLVSAEFAEDLDAHVRWAERIILDAGEKSSSAPGALPPSAKT